MLERLSAPTDGRKSNRVEVLSHRERELLSSEHRDRRPDLLIVGPVFGKEQEDR
jgi:hypothetical protein